MIEGLEKIRNESSDGLFQVDIDDEGAMELAKRARGTPRIANRILRRSRDFAQVKASGKINIDVAKASLEKLGIDDIGLDEMDRKILEVIIDKFKGGPVGLTTIATAVGEQGGTIEEVYEPFLIQEGYIQRTTRGRVALDKAFKYLNVNKDNMNLFK